jgi:hypothetical protein
MRGQIALGRDAIEHLLIYGNVVVGDVRITLTEDAVADVARIVREIEAKATEWIERDRNRDPTTEEA